MSHPGLLLAAASLLQSGDFADFSIQTRDEVFHVHKAILCPQVEYFKMALQDTAFAEGETGVIDWSDEDSAVVRKLLECLYRGDYENGFDEGGMLVEGASTLHLRTFFLAERIQAQHVQETSKNKLKLTLMTEGPVDLIALLSVAYEHGIPPSVAGQELKSMLLDDAITHSHVLPQLAEFQDLVNHHGAFANDFIIALTRNHSILQAEIVLAKQFGNFGAFHFCHQCQLTWALPEDVEAMKTQHLCPLCKGTGPRQKRRAGVGVWKCPSERCRFMMLTAGIQEKVSALSCEVCNATHPVQKWMVTRPA